MSLPYMMIMSEATARLVMEVMQHAHKPQVITTSGSILIISFD